ncbi:hypothetical protein GX50_04756 [[Emmonsia] crescens]|uniref:Uncharacterized protein n=1 Tax=[Emmonsia] crescens TaxID=73230 RepID=A0A2B7ZEQ8_9EURO|nr:hypothetical protein GX50_04756 [Emmonsia crescens]
MDLSTFEQGRYITFDEAERTVGMNDDDDDDDDDDDGGQKREHGLIIQIKRDALGRHSKSWN